MQSKTNNTKKKINAARLLANNSYLIAIVMLFAISGSSDLSLAADPIGIDNINLDEININSANQPISILLHTTNVTITPDRVKCGPQLLDFTVNLLNNGPDPINEVRLYNASYDGVISSLPENGPYTCGPAPASWNLVDLHPFGAPICWYFTNNVSAYINAGQTKIFSFKTAFNAAPLTQEGTFNWIVDSRDTNEAWHPHYPPILVDCSIPNTTKTYLGPQKNVDGTEWISNQTQINFSTTEIPVNPNATFISGINATYYRISLVDDFYCYNNIQNCTGLSGPGDFIKFNGPFSIPDESCHLIEFYSVDNVNNTETKKEQCTFVDTTPPVGNKHVGQPNVFLDGIGGLDYFVNQDTPITLNCTDMGPHPVGQNTVFWRFSSNVTGSWIDGLWQNTKELPVNVSFSEDSYHDLEFYCVDHLNNTGPSDRELFAVDTLPPVISKTIIGPQSGTCPPMNPSDICYIMDHNSTITVNAIDADPHPSNNVKCDWSYTLDGVPQIGGQTGVSVPFNISFPEDSNHTLTITCRDALNNSVTDVENFAVDSIPPVTTKHFDGPQYPLDDDFFGITHWINSNTLIVLEATDSKSGANKTYWRNMLVNNADAGLNICGNPEEFCNPGNYNPHVNLSTPWNEYVAPFQKSEDSCHVIEYYSTDALGNTEPVKWQCVFVDNSPPNVTKEIGNPKIIGKLNLSGSCNDLVGAISAPLQISSAPEIDRNRYYEKYTAERKISAASSNICDSASQPNQCAYVNITDLPNYAKDTIKAQLNVSIDALPQGCEKVLILSSGNPLNNGTTLSEDMGHPGCGPNPDGFTTYDCVILPNYTTSADVSVLAISSEWPEFYKTQFTDWMQISNSIAVDMSINNWKNVTELPQYGPAISGTQTLASNISANSTINLRVADSGDHIYDTSILLVPLACGEPTNPAEKCGDGIVQDLLGEECDLGALNGQPGSGCSATCQIVSVPENESVCGNGILEQPPAFPNSTEQCDLGAQNGKQCSTCSSDCKNIIPDNSTDVTYISSKTPINITCNDVLPHQVDHSSLFYRYRISDDCMSWGDWNNWTEVQGPSDDIQKTIYFNEDSCHELEYYCADILGNQQNVSREIDIVDTKPPVINKTIVGPVFVKESACTDGADGIDPVVLDITNTTGTIVGGVNFSTKCLSGVGVGIAYDGQNLWYSCYASPTDLYRADPFTGNVSAMYSIAGGLGALSYDATRNAIWAGWGGGNGSNGDIRIIQLDGSKNVVNAMFAFTANSGGMEIDDGLAFDAQDDTLYVSPDVSPTIYHYTLNGTLIGTFPKDPGSSCGNSGLALGGSLLYEGFNGCNQVIVVDKANTSSQVFNFSTVQAGDAAFRDEDLECDTNTFANIGKHVMWSIEAYDSGDQKRRAYAFEIPFGSCGIGGKPATNCSKTYIDGVTVIHVEANDAQPHPVNNVTCDWSYTVRENGSASGGATNVRQAFDIHFPEESTHDLTIVCKDALNNTVQDIETFIVDKTPPVTTKNYTGPQFPWGVDEKHVRWISSDTNITLSAYDPEPHPSGVNATYWRNTLVDDRFCNVTKKDGLIHELGGDGLVDGELPNNENACVNATGSGPWNLYTGPFNKPEESCHLIEFFSVDNVNKTENITKQCVFVDNTSPMPNKTVGLPADKWDGKNANYYNISDRCWNGQNNSIDCWKVTTLTPITMSCTDPAPHPVDHSIMAFNVNFDGSDKTEDYCKEFSGEYNLSGDGFCVIKKEDPITFLFKEESEHNLQFYCEDALGNKGPIDEEKFKVEGSSFEIKINKKWNLISVPFVLLNDSMHKVFDPQADKIMSIWTYDAALNKWFVFTPDGIDNDDMDRMMPGWGYWVLARNDTELLIGGSLFSPAKTPPSKQIVPGWNLIGYWGTEGLSGYSGPNGNGLTSFCELNSLISTVWEIPDNSLWSYWEPFNPNQWIPYDKYKHMDPGAGYWMFTNQNGEFVIPTVCSVTPLTY